MLVPVIVSNDKSDQPSITHTKPVAGLLVGWSPALWQPQESSVPQTTAKRKPLDSSSVKDQEIIKVNKEYHEIQEQIEELQEMYDESELQEFIELLHMYNEIKDAGQALLGKLAEIRATTTKHLYSEFDLELND